MLYRTLCETFSSIERTTKRLEMTDHLVSLLRHTPGEEIDRVCRLCLGEVHPAYMGIELGLAEKLAMKAMSSVTGIGVQEIAGNYKRTGDLGKTMEEILARRPQTTLSSDELTVSRVYDTLDRISRASGKGTQQIKIRLLSGILSDASPQESRYLLRTVLGRLRLGIADMTLLDAFAIVFGEGKKSRPDIERAYNLSSDIGHVARLLATKGMDGVKHYGISLGMPIKPQMAERLKSLTEILEKLGGTCAAEYKYDGIRVQAHVFPGKVVLFSRRQENITEQFPDLVRALGDSIKARTAILDGECVPVDPNTGDILPFQVVSQRRGRKHEIEKTVEEVPVVLFLFDALLIDGEDLTQKDYLTRTSRLPNIVKEGESVRIATRMISSDPVKIEAFFEKAINEGTEGLVCKSVAKDSAYEAGKRGWMWIKWKRSYRSEMADTVDLAVVGALAGRGRRAGTYGALLMAAYDDAEGCYDTVCKLGSGFKDEELLSLPQMLGPLVTERRDPRVRALLEADVWVSPSVVLEVIGDEITLSPVHTCAFDAIRKGSGLAIRFPRLVKMRNDRRPEDATTTREITELYRMQLKQVNQ